MQYLKAVETVLVEVLKPSDNRPSFIQSISFRATESGASLSNIFIQGNVIRRCCCFKSFPLKPMNLTWILLEDFRVLSGCCFRP